LASAGSKFAGQANGQQTYIKLIFQVGLKTAGAKMLCEYFQNACITDSSKINQITLQLKNKKVHRNNKRGDFQVC